MSNPYLPTTRNLGASRRVRTRARGHYDAWFPDSAAIYRLVTTPTADFGTTVEYQLVDIAPANHWSVGGREAVVLQRLDIQASLVVSVPAHTPVTAQMELVLTDGETLEVHHLAVTYVRDMARELTRSLFCTEFPLAEDRLAHG